MSRPDRAAPALLLIALALVAPLGAAGAQCVPATRPLDGELPLHRGVRADSSGCTSAFRVVPVEFLLSRRSGVPDGRGNGSAPAVLGRTLVLRAGVEFRAGPLQVRLAPEISSVANTDFLTFASGDSSRSGYASPFYFGRFSADLPSRPGGQSLQRSSLGESGIWLTSATRAEGNATSHADGAPTPFAWSVGATTALPHWGPMFGEGLVLGRSSEGLPRLEARASNDWLGGRIGAAWFGGAAVESPFFDRDADNDLRGVAGLRVHYGRGPWQVSVARTLMDGRRDRAPLAAALRPLLRGADAARDSTIDLLSADLVLHWPESNAAIWVEAARQSPLRSTRDFLLMPTEGLALRVGTTVPIVLRENLRWQVGFEAVRTDQPPQRADRVDQDFYTSPMVVHGWTHRGEPLGAGVGPGGQRQMLSLDRETPGWAIGGFIERIRWNDDALYRVFLPYPLRHDVTLQGGLRIARKVEGWRIGANLTGGQRLNYLFQNGEWIPGYRTDDVGFVQLGLSVGPAR